MLGWEMDSEIIVMMKFEGKRDTNQPSSLYPTHPSIATTSPITLPTHAYIYSYISTHILYYIYIIYFYISPWLPPPMDLPSCFSIATTSPIALSLAARGMPCSIPPIAATSSLTGDTGVSLGSMGGVGVSEVK